MPEQPPAFVVVDKRKFTAEGEIREGYVEPEPERRAPATEEPAEQPATEAASPKVVTMPSPDQRAADDVSEESLAGSLDPLGYQEDFAETGTFHQTGEAPSPQLEGFEDGPEVAAPSAAETEAQAAAYKQSSKDLDHMMRQANPGMKDPGLVAFEHVVQSFYLSAIMAMGAGTEPGQKPRIDILGARQAIDMLSVLEEKTRGNLSAQEQQLLQGITFELRMMFLELTNSITRQARTGVVMPPGGLR
jgi:hypothetical protein